MPTLGQPIPALPIGDAAKAADFYRERLRRSFAAPPVRGHRRGQTPRIAKEAVA